MIPQIRIGIGHDVHAFEAGRPLMIGGIQIPHSHGLAGHSDADVLLHAVVDALLGAAGLGDIGAHFPSSDPQWKGRPSADFLVWTRDRLRKEGFRLVSLDSVIIAQVPIIRPHIPAMEASLRALLEEPEAHIHIKATTTDHLGFVGRKEGIACQAVALISR
jgi:2-C-methyl-D-erythritol 2,4-cyclodiphosphate synthase